MDLLLENTSVHQPEKISPESFVQPIRETTFEEIQSQEKYLKQIRSKIDQFQNAQGRVLLQPTSEQRQQFFNQATSEDEKSQIFQNLITSAETNNGLTLSILHLLGREMDTDWINQLEADADTKRTIETAALVYKQSYLFQENYRLKQILDKQPLNNQQKAEFSRNFLEIMQTTTQLENRYLIATHSTDRKGLEEITHNRKLITYGGRQYLGDSIYAGILGGYLEWAHSHPTNQEEYDRNVAHAFRFRINLSQTNVLVNNLVAPRAMIGIPYSELPVSTTMKQQIEENLPIPIVEPEGETQLFYDEIEDTSPHVIKFLQELIENKVVDVQGLELKQDENGTTYVVLDTHRPPLYWTTVCLALGIMHAAPKGTSVDKLPAVTLEAYKTQLEERVAEKQRIIRQRDSYYGYYEDNEAA